MYAKNELKLSKLVAGYIFFPGPAFFKKNLVGSLFVGDRHLRVLSELVYVPVRFFFSFLKLNESDEFQSIY